MELMHQWFQEPIINQLYARDKSWSLDAIKRKYLPRIMGKEHIPSFIISRNNHSIGFIQYYHLTEHLPEGIMDYTNPLFSDYNQNDLAGIDLFIASHQDRGKGLGASIINRFIADCMMKFKTILVDPDINNIHAIRCYEKAGFSKTGYSKNHQYLIMIKEIGTDSAS